ncbi:MAG: alpha-amylase family glycosyl hydrolase [Nocardioidaceae bacterium]
MVETLPGGRNITGTYRLQLHADAGFEAASPTGSLPCRSGVSHLYLSPILQAGPGSMHGYDVVDHTRISADLGGEAGLVELAEGAHDRGLGLVCDVVPNHMTVPSDIGPQSAALAGASRRSGRSDGGLVRHRLGPVRRTHRAALPRRVAR